MMYIKNHTILILTFITTVGCNDYTASVVTSHDPKSECFEGETRCINDLQLDVCSHDGTWHTSLCPENHICQLDKCITSECSESTYQTRCVDNNHYTVCMDGLITTISCPEQYICTNDKCEPTSVTLECTAETYEPACLDDHTRTLCINGTIAQEPCSLSEFCWFGECEPLLPDPECFPAEYIPYCTDDNYLTICSDYKIEMVPCDENEICSDGQCKPKLECDDDSYKPYCIDETKFTVCTDQKIETVLCPENEICSDGQCKPKPECDDSYKSYCVDETQFTVCTDQKIETVLCPENEICSDGQCKPKPECDDSYKSYCVDETKFTVCTDQKIETVLCAENEICSDGQCESKPECDDSFTSSCIDRQSVSICESGIITTITCPLSEICINGKCEPEDTPCFEDGCDCDVENNYSIKCDGSRAIMCSPEKKIVTYDCAKDDLMCISGQCHPVIGSPCDPSTYKNRCAGLYNYITCDPRSRMLTGSFCRLGWYKGTNSVGGKNYDMAICDTIDGVSGCYNYCPSKSSQSGDVQFCCENQSCSGTCVESDSHYPVMPKDTASLYVCEGNDYCKDGSCIEDTYIGTECKSSDDPYVCHNNRLYHCEDNKLKLIDSCSEYSVCTTFDGYTDCYQECYEAGVTYQCMDYFLTSLRDRKGLYDITCTDTEYGRLRVPKPTSCTKCGNTVCLDELENNCAAGTKDSCHDNDVLHCMTYAEVIETPDGSTQYTDNYTYNYTSSSCGSNTCVMYKNSASCLASCDASQNGKTITRCVTGGVTSYNMGYGSYIHGVLMRSLSQTCTAVGDGYYWINAGTTACPYGCDATTGSCR